MSRYFPNGQRVTPIALWRAKYFAPDFAVRRQLLDKQLAQAQKEINLRVRDLSRAEVVRLCGVIMRFQ